MRSGVPYGTPLVLHALRLDAYPMSNYGFILVHYFIPGRFEGSGGHTNPLSVAVPP